MFFAQGDFSVSWYAKKGQVEVFAFCVVAFVSYNTKIPYCPEEQMLFKIGVLKNSASFTGKHLCWSLILINLQKPPVAAPD